MPARIVKAGIRAFLSADVLILPATPIAEVAPGLSAICASHWPDYYAKYISLRKDASLRPGDVMLNRGLLPSALYPRARIILDAVVTDSRMGAARPVWVRHAAANAGKILARIERDFIEPSAVTVSVAPLACMAAEPCDWAEVAPVLLGALSASHFDVRIYEPFDVKDERNY